MTLDKRSESSLTESSRACIWAI